jgi:hypothetical protein
MCKTKDQDGKDKTDQDASKKVSLNLGYGFDLISS